MTDSSIHLSIIVPVYNAQGYLAHSLDLLDEFVSGLALSAEVILVDDGSADSSLEILKRWSSGQTRCRARVIAQGKNVGKGAAVAKGMLAARGKFRVFLDADMAYHPSQILRILEALEDGADVAVASRVHPDSRYTISPSFFHYLYTRHLASRAINWAMRRAMVPHCNDMHAGLKGFSAPAAEEIFSRQIVRGFEADVEALYLAEKMGMAIREVPVEFRYLSEPTTVVFLQDGLKLIRDVVAIRLNCLFNRYNLRPRGLRKLVINADDFGMTLPISKGILRCAQAGFVRATSAMANSPDFEQSMDLLLEAKVRPDVGFHVVLTWGKPLSDPREIPTLVGSDGMFLSRNALLARSLLGLVSSEELYREIRAQCARLGHRWPELSHMDGHHHVHAFPTVCLAAERVAREFGIRVVRAPTEGLWSPWHEKLVKRFLVAMLAASRPAYWRGRGFSSADRFGGFTLGRRARLDGRWDAVLKRLPPGITEIMVHPGYSSANMDAYNAQREDEMEILAGVSLADTAKRLGIEVASFRDIVP